MTYHEYLALATVVGAFLPLVYLVLAGLLGISTPSPRPRRTVHPSHPRYRYFR